jgi:hypothetical protein
MGTISRFAFNTAPHAKLVGACVLAGLIGVGIAFVAAVLSGRTSVSETGFALADRGVEAEAAAAPLLVTFDRRRDRLDHLSHGAAKADFLAALVDPLDRSSRQLKAMRVTAAIDDVPKGIASFIPNDTHVTSVTAGVATGPVLLIGSAFDAALDGTQRTLDARPDRQSRNLGRTASGAAGSVSGAVGRATGGLGL